MVISLDYRFVSVLQDAGRFKDAKYFDHCEEFAFVIPLASMKASQHWVRIHGIVDVDVTAD